MFRDDEGRASMNSQFAVRVALLGTVALVAFAAIFFRLWYLEVLSGEAYLREANANRTREFKVPAPRGKILDSEGRVLVDNRTVLSLQVRPDKLFRDKHQRNRELRQLAEVAGMTTHKVKRTIREQIKLLPASPVTLERDVDKDIVYSLRERQDRFPGVSAQQVYVRDYPNGTLGAHLFGFVSEVNPEQLKEPAFDDFDPGDQIGASGIESAYDGDLRGRSGFTRVQVDAFGQPRGKELKSVEPKPGNNLVLTLDEKIQAAGESAVSAFGLPAAFVVMNVDDGSVLGMGPYPTFDPDIYTPPVSTRSIEALVDDETAPITNRATQSAYPTGSTFKLITATAALEEGLITPTTPYSDSGYFNYGGRDWINAGRQANGVIDMTSALQVSSDVYFYSLGIDAEQVYEKTGEEPIQDWAKQYGFGSLTGIDLPAEGAGLLPTPEWRNELYDEAADPDSDCGTERVYDPARDCYETDRKWSVGDNMNLAVGQGDLGATPLQLAVAYAALGNGGRVVRPHLGERVEDRLGRTTQQFEPAPRREIPISDETRTTIMEGLRAAANDPGGTSAGVFGGYPVEIAGKTGTAEGAPGVEDQSWYAALAPGSVDGSYDDPKYVVVVTVERGGFGADSAAPAARAILNEIYGLDESDIDEVELANGAD